MMGVSTDNTGAMRGASEASGLYRPSSPRPAAPHLSIYRWPITMAASIAHRISGAALYVGALFLAVYISALSIGGGCFAAAQALYSSVLGQIILFLYTLALMQHMLGGLRHLFWDAKPQLLEKHCASKAAWANFIAAAALTAAVWAVARIWL